MSDLKSYFTDVGAKYLSKVDVGKQHEIGSNNFTSVLGDPGHSKIPFNTVSIYYGDQDEPVRASGVMTWYDTRLCQDGRRPEFRLYYKKSTVSELMRAGDFCIIALRPDKSLLIVFARANSTAEQQLRWLFDIGGLPDKGFSLQQIDLQRTVNITEASILEELGIEPRLDDERWLDTITGSFGESFPSTARFSEFSRKTCPNQFSPVNEPDGAIIAWLEHEEMLFRTLERRIVQKQLDAGFDTVDHFIKFSLGVQNRRKSRVGLALEHHLSEVFKANSLPFSRQAITENRATVDFMFPSEICYHDADFPVGRLVMLASKSTCKDRWRQVLAEGAKIKSKHLFTLEPAISTNQTDEMNSHMLKLVVPKKIFSTYNTAQQSRLLDLSGFIEFVRRIVKR
ncbi:restriction endonuclease [Pseudomonas syringae pv. actinidifoliorum]|uniref:type II restriction endonuclease n=1 Tax=Pseudomonas syringae TaxID=317 RepID=UPI0013730640|nr:type II restriction endonuclease [Pseudomonas syringae]NAS95372.1 restriction endonuclease [Pseudomonas syringae pv. actinidifoliorum]NAT62907.1 restriction endonuclease [Pseudomonas syringae pv. actinidifoliorum]